MKNISTAFHRLSEASAGWVADSPKSTVGSEVRRVAQIQREWEVFVHCLRWREEFPLGRAVHEEAGQSAGFGFVGVDREGGVAEAPRVRDVVLATAEAALVPGVEKVEGEWRV